MLTPGKTVSPLFDLKEYDLLLIIFKSCYFALPASPSLPGFIHFKIQTMKTRLFNLSVIILSMALFISCQRDAQEQLVTPKSPDETTAGDELTSRGRAVCNTDVYDVLLESKTPVNGNWEWVWSFQNTNPGNGTNGTAQDLSHWGIPFGACFPTSSIVGAAYSSDGINWTSFTPIIHVDPSVSCLTTPVLKFDFGTVGSIKSYYRLTLSQDFPPAWSPAYAKSGSNCCIFNFDGIGCNDGGGGTEE